MSAEKVNVILAESGIENLVNPQKVGAWEAMLQKAPEAFLNLGIRVLFALLVYLIGRSLIRVLIRILTKSLEKTILDKGIVQFIDSCVRVLCYLVLILLIATQFGLDAATVIAVLGSAGVAIGLAVQGSLSNFAGGVLILVTKPFSVGDYIILNGSVEGTVKEIRIFHTKMITADNKGIMVPNGSLSSGTILNVSENPIRRVDLSVGIHYDADIRSARAVLLACLAQNTFIEQEQPKQVLVDSLSDSSIDLIVRFWVKQENYWDARFSALEECKYALDEAGIKIPYPQMEVHLNS